jgi:hypothetical protein
MRNHNAGHDQGAIRILVALVMYVRRSFLRVNYRRNFARSLIYNEQPGAIGGHNTRLCIVGYGGLIAFNGEPETAVRNFEPGLFNQRLWFVL